MRKFGHYAGIIFIMFWGLAPFYWMLVTALRDQRFTFDTTPWPTHVTPVSYTHLRAHET